MKPRLRRFKLPGGGTGRRGLWLAALPLLLLEPPGLASGQVTVIRADRVWTSTSEGIVGPRFIVLDGGRIVSVTEDAPVGLPPGARVLRAGFVSPGFIDARTTLGLSGLHPADDDRDETSGPNQAHLRAIDAFDLNDPRVGHALRGGVTTVQAGPGDANSIGGQAGIFKLSAETVGAAVVRFPSGMVLSLDESAKRTYGSANRFPSTRMANVGLIRQAFLDADRYRTQAAGKDPPARDLKKEAIAMVLDGAMPALVSAERADELSTALRLKEEFGFQLTIVGASDAQVVLDRLVAAAVPVLLGPAGDAALRSEAGELLASTPARLHAAGVPFALVTGDDENAPRWTLLELVRAAVRGGLPPDEALGAVTLAPAGILGLDGELGSVEAGKNGDLVLFDGDPMRAETRVTGVFVSGKAVYLPGG